jgi:multidrug resistance efflux pump
MRGKGILFAAVVVLLAIAAGALSRRWRTEPAAAPAPPPAAEVSAGREASIAGVIRARHTVEVAAPTAGVIEAFLVADNEDVAEGQPLARIRSGKLEVEKERAALELEKAESKAAVLESSLTAARLEASRAEAAAARLGEEWERLRKVYERQKMLLAEGATPRRTFEKAEREFEEARQLFDAAQANARLADENAAGIRKQLDAARSAVSEKRQEAEEAAEALAASELKSPVDGMLLSHRGTAGESVSPEMKDLFTIAVDLTQLDVVLEPPPPLLARIKPGQAAGVQIAELGGQEIAGRVREVKGAQVFVEFLSPTLAIRPGLTAQVRIRLE